MKIVDVPRFVLGCANITLATLLLVLIIFYNRRSRAYLACILCFSTGIGVLVDSIETEKQRQRRKEELEALAELYGLNKKEEEE